MSLLRRAGSLLFLAGCTSAAPSPPAAPSSLDRTTAMLRHEALGIAIRDAVVNGDLPTARRDAELLGKVMLQRRAPDPDLTKMHAATDAIAKSTDLDSAAHGMSDLVLSCADCHGGRRQDHPAAARRAEPPAGMHRHAWAINELWDGLVDGTEDRWQLGAETLADPANAVMPTSHAVRNAESSARLIAALGHRAETTNELPARAVIYGELIETCAACHLTAR